MAISADRLFGYHHWWTSVTPELSEGAIVTGVEISEKGDQVALLTGGTYIGAGAALRVNPQAVPRLGVDFVINPGVTLGASLTYYSTSSETTQSVSTAAVTQKNNELSMFGVTARVGYAVMFSDVFGLWPRAGITYGTQVYTYWNYPSLTASPTEEEWSVNYVSLDPEFLVVVTPVPHFGLLFGLAGSFGVAGGYTGKAAGLTLEQGDSTLSDIGVTAGLMGYF